MKRLSRTVEHALMFGGLEGPLDAGYGTAMERPARCSFGCSFTRLSDFSRAFVLPAGLFAGGLRFAPLRCFLATEEVLP